MIARDKQLHIVAGAVIAVLCILMGAGPLFGLVAAVVAGAAKEAYDATGRGQVELWDFLCTAAGGLLIYNLVNITG